MPTNFDKSYIAPEFEKYSEDDNKDGSPARMPKASVIKVEPTPEVGENYINVEIMLPREPLMERGRAISCKRWQPCRQC